MKTLSALAIIFALSTSFAHAASNCWVHTGQGSHNICGDTSKSRTGNIPGNTAEPHIGVNSLPGNVLKPASGPGNFVPN